MNSEITQTNNNEFSSKYGINIGNNRLSIEEIINTDKTKLNKNDKDIYNDAVFELKKELRNINTVTFEPIIDNCIKLYEYKNEIISNTHSYDFDISELIVNNCVGLKINLPGDYQAEDVEIIYNDSIIGIIPKWCNIARMIKDYIQNDGQSVYGKISFVDLNTRLITIALAFYKEFEFVTEFNMPLDQASIDDAELKKMTNGDAVKIDSVSSSTITINMSLLINDASVDDNNNSDNTDDYDDDDEFEDIITVSTSYSSNNLGILNQDDARIITYLLEYLRFATFFYKEKNDSYYIKFMCPIYHINDLKKTGDLFKNARLYGNAIDCYEQGLINCKVGYAKAVFPNIIYCYLKNNDIEKALDLTTKLLSKCDKNTLKESILTSMVEVYLSANRINDAQEFTMLALSNADIIFPR